MAFDFKSLDTQRILELGQPCQEYSEALKSRKAPSLDFNDAWNALATLRRLTELHDGADKPDPQVRETTFHAPCLDGSEIPVKIFKNAHDTSEPSALLIIYFGGAFVLGSPTQAAPLARTLVKRFDLVVAVPAYRLAPEHPFPIGVNDGYEAFKWIVTNATGELGADPSKGLLVGGVSAGGTIANIVAHRARDEGFLPPITGVWLSCSGVRIAPRNAGLLPEHYAIRNLSRQQKEIKGASPADFDKLTKDALKPDYESRLFAPMIWSDEDDSLGHKGLPKTYFQVCGMEPSRDEQLIFEDMIKSLGVETKLDLYAGLPHAFFHTFPELPQSKSWQDDTVAGFAWLLGYQL